MKVKIEDFRKAASKEIISQAQITQLWTFLGDLKKDSPHFKFSHVAYYFGGLIIISALAYFLAEVWETSGGGAIFLLGVGYGIVLYAIGHYLWIYRDLKIPGGILIAAAVSMTPLVIYGFQKMAGLWPEGTPEQYQDYHLWIKGSWFFLELGTILVSLLVCYFFRFPLILAPAAFSLFYMSMDITPLIFGKSDFSLGECKLFSLIFGLITIVASYIVDLRQRKEDYAFWGYLFGTAIFWGSLSLMESKSEFSAFLYCLLNVFMIFISVFLRRLVFMAFGAAGVFAYIGHLVYKIFRDSFIFPLALSALGLAVIFVAIYYQRTHRNPVPRIDNLFSRFLQRMRPPER